MFCSPVHGVIFLFKYPTGETPTDVPKDGSYDFDAAENLFFAAQTIQNACGTQALLSVILNKEKEIEIGPQLKDFKEFTAAFPSEVGLLSPDFSCSDFMILYPLTCNHHAERTLSLSEGPEMTPQEDNWKLKLIHVWLAAPR